MNITSAEALMEEIPGYPLDPNLKLLPPQEWRVVRCGADVVAIGAWLDTSDRRHWRAFRFEAAGKPATPLGDGEMEFYILPDGPKVRRIPDA